MQKGDQAGKTHLIHCVSTSKGEKEERLEQYVFFAFVILKQPECRGPVFIGLQSILKSIINQLLLVPSTGENSSNKFQNGTRSANVLSYMVMYCAIFGITVDALLRPK